MFKELEKIRIGLALVLLCLVFGIGMGVSFGVSEESYQNYIAAGIQAHPQVHDTKSEEKIWRYAQRAHFHATGISAFSLGLIILLMFSDLKTKLKSITAILIGLSAFYPLAWFTMFLLAPSLGRDAAHEYFLTKLFTAVGVGGLLAGVFILAANLFLRLFREEPGS